MPQQSDGIAHAASPTRGVVIVSARLDWTRTQLDEDRTKRTAEIIAHVDHEKTTVVDGMLKQARVFRENQAVAERVMASNELERERGITILAKDIDPRVADGSLVPAALVQAGQASMQAQGN